MHRCANTGTVVMMIVLKLLKFEHLPMCSEGFNCRTKCIMVHQHWNICHVEDIASSHACNPALGEVLSTRKSCSRGPAPAANIQKAIV